MKVVALAFIASSTQAVRFMSNQEKLYEQSFIQTSTEKVIEDLPPFNGWGAHLNGFPGTQNEYGDYFQPYTRSIPERFTGDVALDSYPVDKFT